MMVGALSQGPRWRGSNNPQRRPAFFNSVRKLPHDIISPLDYHRKQ
jgi:hypothetical protein